MIHESDSHNAFLVSAREYISTVESDTTCCLDVQTEIFLNINAAQEWQNYDMQEAVQNADKELAHFESRFVNQHNKIL